MGMRELLEEAGYPYETTLRRFSNNEALLKKFLCRFAEDPTFGELTKGIEDKDYEKILMQAHTLKGVGANLGFDQLSQECAEIVSAVREERYEDIQPFFERAQREYDSVIACVSKIEA